MAYRSAHEGEALPPDEIEVTPEMIEAGTKVLIGWNPKFESPEICVEAIYLAMATLPATWRETRRKRSPSRASLGGHATPRK